VVETMSIGSGEGMEGNREGGRMRRDLAFMPSEIKSTNPVAAEVEIE
jgi:hypothetical protein